VPCHAPRSRPSPGPSLDQGAALCGVGDGLPVRAEELVIGVGGRNRPHARFPQHDRAVPHRRGQQIQGLVRSCGRGSPPRLMPYAVTLCRFEQMLNADVPATCSLLQRQRRGCRDRGPSRAAVSTDDRAQHCRSRSAVSGAAQARGDEPSGPRSRLQRRCMRSSQSRIPEAWGLDLTVTAKCRVGP
jgi:hypothetical protein